MTDYKDLKGFVNREVDWLNIYASWEHDHDECSGCYNNVKNDHCFHIKNGEPWECPYFNDRYEEEQIRHQDYLALLLFADQVLNRMAFVLNGKKYKLTEVE